MEASLTESSLGRTVESKEKDTEFERLKLIESAEMTEDEYDYFKSKSKIGQGESVFESIVV